MARVMAPAVAPDEPDADVEYMFSPDDGDPAAPRGMALPEELSEEALRAAGTSLPAGSCYARSDRVLDE